MSSSAPEAHLPGTHNDRRVTAFRERVGERVMANETARTLENKIRPYLVEQFAELAKSHGAGTETAVPLPVTTRGVGFNNNIFYDNMCLRNHRLVRALPSVAPLYRLSLLQAKRQLYLSQSVGLAFGYDFIYDAPRQILNDNRFKNLLQENSFLLKLTLDGFGCVEDASRLYRPYVPDYKEEEYYPQGREAWEESLKYGERYAIWRKLLDRLREKGCDDEIAGPPPSPVPTATGPVRLVRVDPYLVTIDNLRQTVECLSDPNYPQEWRSYFRRLNPIPGAIWNDFDVLQNPDAIIPADYSEMHYCNDLSAVAAFFRVIKNEDRAYVVPTVATGVGSKVSLATLSQVFDRSDPIRSFAIDSTSFPQFTIRNSAVLEDATLLTSVLSMSSELPPNSHQDEQWAIRSPRTSMRSVNYSWVTLVTEVLTARF